MIIQPLGLMLPLFSPPIQEALTQFFGQDLAALPLGRHLLREGTVWANIETYQTHPLPPRLESHQKFLDLHYVFGREQIACAFPENCTCQTPYDEKHDVTWWQGQGQTYLLSPDKVALIMPGEIHAAGIQVETPAFVRKIVVKVAWPIF